MEAFFGRDVKEKASLIDDLLTAFSATEVVSTQDIFRRVLVGTGFHGESRILRYLFIEWASDYLVSNSTAKRLREDLDNSRGDTTCQYRLELIKYMERKFVSRAREWGMVFGSSQGTCTGCCRALDICFAKRGKTGNPSKQWLDPLDQSGFQGETHISVAIRQHALNLVLQDFDNSVPEDVVPENWGETAVVGEKRRANEDERLKDKRPTKKPRREDT